MANQTYAEAALEKITPLLGELNLKSLKELQALVSEKFQAAQQAELDSARNQIMQIAASVNMTPQEILAAVEKPAVTAKYKDPNSDQTWTGRGREPGWFIAAKNRGYSAEQMLISK